MGSSRQANRLDEDIIIEVTATTKMPKRYFIWWLSVSLTTVLDRNGDCSLSPLFVQRNSTINRIR